MLREERSSTTALAYDVTEARTGTPDAPVAVFLGSLGSDLSMWAPQADALRDRYRVITVDHRGHGRSPVPDGPYAISELADDVVALFDSLGISAAHVVGLSLGGAVAQYLAVLAPHRVRTLSLLCTAAKFGEPQGWIDRAATSRGQGAESLADAVVGRWFTREFADGNPEFIARHRSMIAATPDEGYAACCEALSEWDFTAELGRIDAPTLVIAGKNDPSTPPAVMQVLADRIAGARFEVLDHAAHLANLEQADTVTGLLRAHFEADEEGR